METGIKAVSSADFAPIMEQFCEQAQCDLSTFKKEASFAAQLINASDQLSKTDANSRMQSVLNVAQVGLTLNPTAKQGYLVPRWNKKAGCMKCEFAPSYIGLVKLLTDAGSIRTVYANIVYEGDFFDIEMGSTQEVRHKPYAVTGQPKGEIKAVYCVAILPTGEKQIEFMGSAEIVEIRDRSETYKAFTEGKIKSCTWNTDTAEMYRKTILRRFYKYLPKSTNQYFNERIEKAIDLDKEAAGFNTDASFTQISYIESLLQNSNIDHDQRETIMLRVEHGLTEREAGKMIEDLKEKQLDFGMTGIGGAKEINAHIKKITQ